MKFEDVLLCSFIAEKFVESIEPNKNYPVLLLHLIDKGDVDIHIRVSAAIAFKNFVKRNWRVVSAAKIDVERLLVFQSLLIRRLKTSAIGSTPTTEML